MERDPEVRCVHRVKAGVEIEPHFHDCNEYWIIMSGEGDAITEGSPYRLTAGDMLLTRAGDIHSMIVTEDMVAVTYYGVMPPQGRSGHLHAGVDADWHAYLAAL